MQTNKSWVPKRSTNEQAIILSIVIKDTLTCPGTFILAEEVVWCNQ